MTQESDIKRDVLKFLNSLPRSYFRTIQIGSIGGRTNLSKGIPDLIGSFQGIPMAIEIKTPAGKLSPEQIDFMDGWTKAGGISAVVRSLEDAILVIEHAQLRLSGHEHPASGAV